MDKLNQWLTLFANLGVLAGIFFLAYEIQQNTEMMKAQTRDSIAEKEMMFADWIGTNERAAEVLVKGVWDELERGSVEYTMFSYLYSGIWREWENSLYQYDMGLFDESELEGRLVRWRLNMSFPGVRKLWKRTGVTYSARLQKEIGEIVANTAALQRP